jgi:hypothetical protein
MTMASTATNESARAPRSRVRLLKPYRPRAIDRYIDYFGEHGDGDRHRGHRSVGRRARHPHVHGRIEPGAARRAAGSRVTRSHGDPPRGAPGPAGAPREGGR